MGSIFQWMLVRRATPSPATNGLIVTGISARRLVNRTVASFVVSLSTREYSVSNDDNQSNTVKAIGVDLAEVNKTRRIVSPDWLPSEVNRTSVPGDLLVRTRPCPTRTISYIIRAIEGRLSSVEHHIKHIATSPRFERSSEAAAHTGLVYQSGSVGPLILAPTRESAIQIAIHAQRHTTHQQGFQVQLLVGGADRDRQRQDWSESSRDLVVATPGRLRDLLTNAPEFQHGLKSCPLLVLDGADTLLSMGFRDDIEAIVSFLPRSPLRRTLLFSAAMSRAVRQLASWILSPDHTFIDAAVSEPGSSPSQNVLDPKSNHNGHAIHGHTQLFYMLCPAPSDQLPTLLKLLAHDQLIHGSRSKVIVFCPTVQVAELFSLLLRSLADSVLPDNRTKVVKMHLKMKPSERERACEIFHENGMTQDAPPVVLVTSDISPREVDYPEVTRIIQIGIPYKEAMYTHRIQRLARTPNSSAPVKGTNKLPTRADLLLLPWEAGYMNWQLTSLPIRSLPISDLDTQLTSLASPLTTEFLTSALAGVQHRINPADVRGAAASLLGYYLPLTPPLRLQPHAVVAGVSSWAAECFGVTIPAIRRLPKKFTDAYEQHLLSRKTKGLSVDGLRLAGPSSLGKTKSKNRSVWEGANVRTRRPKRWY